MPLHVGIDLGTTNSTVSVIKLESRRDEPMEKLSTVPIYQLNERGTYDSTLHTLPSYLYFSLEEKAVYTGHYAKQIYKDGSRPMHTIKGIKTRIGGESLVEIPAGPGNPTWLLDMVQCSAILLKTIKISLEEQFSETVKEVVITVPAAFNTDERQATIKAALIAGFKECHILDEPTATLIHYINDDSGDLSSHRSSLYSKNIMVYDIGGGTLDVCIARIDEDENENPNVRILSRSPRKDIGGNNFDQLLGAYFLTTHEQSNGEIQEYSTIDQHKIISKIVSQAESYKIELSDFVRIYRDKPRRLNRKEIPVVFDCINNRKVQCILTKTIADQLFACLTDEDTGELLKPVDQCLREADLERNDVDLVLLTGGMSEYYVIDDKIKEFFDNGKTVIIPVDSKFSVSKGAAIHSCSLSGNERLTRLEVHDRMADDIYIKVADEFENLIPRSNTSGKGEHIYTVPSDHMLKIPVFLYSGLSVDKREEFCPIAGKHIHPNRPIKKGEKIKLSWSMDKDKIINIICNDFLSDLQLAAITHISPEKASADLIHSLVINPWR